MAERPTSERNPNTQRTILVTGATGKQGGAAARHLRDRGFPVRTLTRHPDKPQARALIGHGIEVIEGNFDDPGSLARALDGVYGVFSVQNPMDAGVDGEIRQGKTLADAAQRQQISHFVYTSVAGSERKTGIPFFDSKFQIEEHLRGLGMPWTILRPAFFMENWLGMAGSFRDGAVSLPLTPDRRLQQIAVDDIGGIAATAFEHPAHWQGRAVELASDENAMTDIAAALGRAMGREIRYVQMPWNEFEKHTGEAFTKMFRWLQNEGGKADIAALRYDYPQLTRFEEWARRQDWRHAGESATARR